MNPSIVLILTVAALSLIGLGTYLNFRSVKAGRGPDRIGIAIQALTLGIVLIGVVAVAMAGMVRAELWPAALLLIPFVLAAGLLLVGALQRLRH
jgi:hypothetical protein